MLVPGLTASSPNWLENATYKGVKEFNNVMTNVWLNNPFTDLYYETLKTKTEQSLPVALSVCLSYPFFSPRACSFFLKRLILTSRSCSCSPFLAVLASPAHSVSQGHGTAIEWNTFTVGPQQQNTFHFPTPNCQKKCPCTYVTFPYNARLNKTLFAVAPQPDPFLSLAQWGTKVHQN